ncbi:MAG: DUF1538 domain-containing protein [Saprospiraceae bacterium]|nr:DUF1538 domain-containing protein [Saprospiraceae bacterium]
MIKIISDLADVLFSTIIDVLPVFLIIASFQFFVLKQKIPDVKRVLLGVVFVIFGLSLFLMGLEKALFPIGNIMATQLSDPLFIADSYFGSDSWLSYYWIYLFAAMIGFATAIAEPSLMAVAMKANEVSGGTISQNGLRVTVAIGVSIALALGTIRIVTGTPLYIYILGSYLIVVIQTIFAPKNIIPLAFDSGGVTTSTVTVPIVAAIGIGLSSVVPGRNPAVDGFGLIALACLFPIITVLGYAQFVDWKTRKNIKK